MAHGHGGTSAPRPGSAPTPVQAAGRLATDWERRMDEVERPHRDALQRFLRGLANPARPVFMFFTGGKLHLVDRAVRYLTAENLILIGSALSGEEAAWLREHHSYPLFEIPIRVDGNTVWEFLFDCCDANFAWVDSDCFVFDPALPGALFDAIEADPDKIAIAGTFVFRPVELVCTPFAAVNTRVVRQVRDQVGQVTPGPYAYVNTPLGRTVPHAVARRVTAAHRAAMGRVVALDERGRPAAPQEGILDAYGDGSLFPATWRGSDRIPAATVASGRLHLILDTLVLYELVALGLGFSVRPVLRIGNYLGLEGVQGTSQVLHVGGVASHLELPPEAVSTDRVGLGLGHRMHRARQVDRALLEQLVAAGAPDAYEERMARLGPPEAAADRLSRESVIAELASAGITGFL